MESKLDNNIDVHYAWPTDGLRLITDKGPWNYNAIPGAVDGRNPDWNQLAEGFKLAADAIIDADESVYRPIDLLLYPILHLYRHSFELSMKGIIGKGEQLLSREQTVRITHSLESLWKACKRIVCEFYEDKEFPEFQVIDSCIGELDNLGSSFNALRYPKDKDGSPLSLNAERINLLSLKASFDAVHNVLDCIDTDFACKLDSLCEMRSHYE